MKTIRASALLLAGALLLPLLACAGEEDRSAEQPDADAMEGMNGMGGMEGMDMGGMEGSDDMMSRMQMHMQMMRAMSGDSMQAMLATHRQMMANMIAQMNREMGDMNMAADASWSATMDSLRNDLTRMAEMDPSELQAMMPGHHRRAMRLMEMHGGMMGDMEM